MTFGNLSSCLGQTQKCGGMNDFLTYKVYRIMLIKHFINSNIVHSLSREWVSDCCLTPIEQFFSYIMTRTSYMYIQWNADVVVFVLDQHAYLGLDSASSLKQQSARRYVDTYMLSGCELIDTENISLSSQNMKFIGEWAKRMTHKLHILSNRLIFFSINHIHIQMTYLSSLNQP